MCIRDRGSARGCRQAWRAVPLPCGGGLRVPARPIAGGPSWTVGAGPADAARRQGFRVWHARHHPAAAILAVRIARAMRRPCDTRPLRGPFALALSFRARCRPCSPEGGRGPVGGFRPVLGRGPQVPGGLGISSGLKHVRVIAGGTVRRDLPAGPLLDRWVEGFLQ
eukprot:5467666-Pyramimonas_sp.AAC.1